MLVELERLADSLPFVSDEADAAMRERAVDLVSRNMALKAAVVSADEREADLRTFLNYGHTIGHAIEKVSGYGRYLHGEGVAIGLVGAAMIGERMGLIDAALVERHRSLLEAFGLPVRRRDRGGRRAGGDAERQEGRGRPAALGAVAGCR
jgi:3-dehydroquinate synthetase